MATTYLPLIDVVTGATGQVGYSLLAVYIVLIVVLFLYRWTCARSENVSGKNIFITGGSTGIGLSVAKEYAKIGANVCIFARTKSKLIKAVKDIKSCAVNDTQDISYVCMDVTNFESVKDAIDEAAVTIGEPDILITAAGQAIPGYFLEQDVETFKYTMELNYLGNVHAIKAVTPYMVAKQKGNICIIGSAASVVSFIGYSSYSPTKFALRGLADSLRNELNGFNIQVSMAYPPDTDTPGFKLENEKKPQETKDCFPGDAYSSESVASSLIYGISRNDYHIQSPDYLQNLLVWGMSGVTPRTFPLLEIVFLPIIALVMIPFHIWFDYVARGYAKRVISQENGSGKKDN
eukprot:g59.t1